MYMCVYMSASYQKRLTRIVLISSSNNNYTETERLFE